jgi:hypothetical protein
MKGMRRVVTERAAVKPDGRTALIEAPVVEIFDD